MDQKKIAVKIFAEGITDEIKEYLPPEYEDMECEMAENVRMNGITRIGICFHMPDQRVSPVIYMEGFYDAVRNGKPLEEIKEEIADLIVKNSGRDINIPGGSTGMDFDLAKECLSIRLVNTNANRAMLSSVPHMKVENLSIMFTLNLKERDEPDTIGSIKVTNDMMLQWGIDKKELYQAAMQNVLDKETPVLRSMEEMLSSIVVHQNSRNLLQEKNPFRLGDEMGFILTNKEGIYGAAALFYPGVMDKISSIFPEGFYVIPSSTHELIIISKSNRIAAKELGETVREVNKEVVDREEYLSDRVYEYDKEQKKIRQVTESMKKEKAVER